MEKDLENNTIDTTIRRVPTETMAKLRVITAKKTLEKKGEGKISLNDTYLEALNWYVEEYINEE